MKKHSCLHDGYFEIPSSGQQVKLPENLNPFMLAVFELLMDALAVADLESPEKSSFVLILPSSVFSEAEAELIRSEADRLLSPHGYTIRCRLQAGTQLLSVQPDHATMSLTA